MSLAAPATGQPVATLDCVCRLLLLGTNVDGRAASALVRNMDSEEVRWLRVGESFDGWRLSAMSADQARFVCQTFEGEDCAYTLSLYSDGGERQ